MNINSIQSSQPSFKHLIDGNTIRKKFRTNKVTNSFVYEYDKIDSLFRFMGWNSKENVDIILQYRPKDGFYGVISSKKYGVPHDPEFKCNISTKSKDITTFNHWVEVWNEAFSAKGLKEYKKHLK